MKININKKSISSVLSGVSFLLFSISTFAQNSSDSIKIKRVLDEVTVTASRFTLPIAQVAKQVTIISKAEIDHAPIQSIQDLFNYVAGIDVVQRGGHGVQADISIRGGSFDQTAILLNGVNISNPQTGHLSFNMPVNLNDIERIEILHGPSSFVYGASAFSGGINIITKKEPDHKIYGKVQAGEHALWGVEAGGGFKVSKSTNQVSVGYNKSDGYIANSDYRILNTLWQTHFNVEKSVIDIQLGYNNKKYGANTFYSPLYPNQYEETQSYLASVRGETGAKLKFIPSVYWNQQHDVFQLIKGDESKVPFNHHRIDVYGSNLNLQYTSTLGLTSLGAEFRNEGVVSTVLGEVLNKPEGKYTKGVDRTNVSYTLEHTYQLDKLTLTGGVMVNYNTSTKGNYKFYPTVGVSFRPLDNFKIYSSWSKATRMPSFTDLYYNTTTHKGNIDLKPEESESFDLGTKYYNSYLSVSATGYLMHGKNMIDWVKNGNKWQSMNLATINKQGLEIELKFNLYEALSFFYPNSYIQFGYNRMHQDGNNISKEQSSSYVLNYLRDKFVAQLFLPIYKDILTTSCYFRWQKRMGTYEDYSQGIDAVKSPFPSFSTMDIKTNFKVSTNCIINLDINNIYNTHYFDMGSLPQAGFWLIGGISYTL